MKKNLKTDKAPQAIGPYSQAVVCGGMLYASGQIPINPETGEMQNSSIEEETHQVMKNIGAILEAANINFSNIIKTTIFITDMNDFSIVNEVYASYFSDDLFPARETVQVAALPKKAKVEISIIAHI